MTDVFFGDLSIIPAETVRKINEACEKNIVAVPMKAGESTRAPTVRSRALRACSRQTHPPTATCHAGDVLLCDNYRVLHGRDVFNGDRLHAVSWFGDGTTKADKGDKPGDILNNLINSAF